MRSIQQTLSGKRSGAESGRPQYADRAYRSAAGFAGGVLLLVLAGWLGGDAVISGSGHAPWLALAALLLAVPLIVAFTIRPVVFAGAERIRIRNPFRTVTLPWSAVDQVRSSYSTELFSGDRKFQLWAIPVSMRARKRAVRQTSRAERAAANEPFGGGSLRRGRGSRGAAGGADGEPIRAWSDQAVAELRDLAERHSGEEGAARTEPVIRWCYEIIAPAVAGAVVLVVLLAIGG
ncbi:PH domain-containing protein [Streptomyces sp. DvalAA-14]|uniref:PH domain-containing protein n=1 Tax=unclassified Streptomyces TaxID=2593676 RepID=UPI00081B7A0C|nr:MULTISPECIES: PH domain-containing protein [unclassified Streptomyces]MYS19941.1 PH domain-containing protein [Streptomyces sp. SID4948]SCD56897.1 PH domain-containing protein [Streptomyces sp. DvalAA-14]